MTIQKIFLSIFTCLVLCGFCIPIYAQDSFVTYSSPRGYRIQVPSSWQKTDPTQVCGPNSFCFVMNPEQVDLMFVDLNLPKKLERGDLNQPAYLRDLLTVSVVTPSTDPDLGRMKKQIEDGMKTFQESGMAKNFEMKRSEIISTPKGPRALLEMNIQVGDYPTYLQQALIPMGKDVLFASCVLDQARVTKRRALCEKILGSIEVGPFR